MLKSLLLLVLITLPAPAFAVQFITQSGTAANPLIYDGGNALTDAFDVTGSYIIIRGWQISNQTNHYGVYLHGGASHVTVENNVIYELCDDGIFMDRSVSYISVLSNFVGQAAMSGIHIDGDHDSVIGNQIQATWQYPDKLGGVYAGCVEKQGADADSIRFFGTNHTISYNVTRAVPYGGWGSTASPNPHTDCFQTFGAAGETTDNILIQNNDCRLTGADPNKDTEIGSLTAVRGTVGTIYINYNTFADMRQGFNIAGAGGGPVTVNFDHNSVAHVLQEALIWHAATSADSITNSIFYDSGGAFDPYSTSAVPAISNNDCILGNGHRCAGSIPAASQDPLFISLGSPNNPWPDTWDNMDFHLQSNSPVPTMGAFPLQ